MPSQSEQLSTNDASKYVGDREACYSLSPLQQGMLFHSLVDRHSGTDIEQIIGEFEEPIDAKRLERAWHDVLNTFDGLRTAFMWEGLPHPQQRIDAKAALPFTSEDLRDQLTTQRQQTIAAFLSADRKVGFDLARPPAMRVRLFRVEDARFVMVWTFHHILFDVRSVEPILTHLFDAYADRDPKPATRPLYRDYVAWIAEQDLERPRAFWREKLAGMTAPTTIPTDQVGASEGDRYGAIDLSLSAATTERLRALVAEDGLSLKTVLLAAWALLLSNLSGEKDVLFGATKTTHHGTIPGGDQAVGLLLATVPMRVRVDADISVREWLRHVRAEWLSLRGSELIGLVDIRAESEIGPSYQLFDSLVMYENSQFGTQLRHRGGEWANRRFSIREQTGLPLTLLGYGDAEFSLKLEYDTHRFERSTAQRLLGYVANILESWSRDAQSRVSATAILAPDERKTILETWNATAQNYPFQESLAALVERQVERAPDSPAVTFGAETITYAQLNARANRLARALVEHGAGPNVLIGLAVERSIDMMVALLAIIKSGSAYLPLDTMFPKDRVAYMMADGDAPILITQTHLVESLPAFSGTLLMMDAPSWLDRSGENLDVPVEASDLALVIYTSGSTGRPKGVEVSRRALINLLWSMREWLGLDSNDRILAVTTISFDIAGMDIWLPWLVGARTVMATREVAGDGERVRALIDEHDITFLQATPITWRQLLGTGWPGKANMQAACGGEAMPLEVAHSLVSRVGRLWNLYGPTETTIWSTGVEVRTIGERISIGRPIANTQCYILNEALEPVPVGVVGELYIAGDGLARGYRNRPDLTAERFVSNPFSGIPQDRMYRTGDLARYLPDGTIECLGRNDHQVKIRGFRIELGEIESRLAKHGNVQQATVVVRDDVSGNKQIVAYVVLRETTEGTKPLRSYLREHLPEYMVPSVVVPLESMPLTANGKVDRRSLPAPETDPQPDRLRVSARTHVEKQLSEIWEEIFHLPQVSVLDSFFDLGGHSILAVQMMSRVAQVFGKQLPLNALFEAPTIERLAKRIEDATWSLDLHTIVSIQASGTRPPVFWIPGGAALGLFRLRSIVTRLGPDQPVYGLGSNRPASLGDLEGVEVRATKYLELIRRLRPHGPYCFVGFCSGGLVAFEMAQQLVAAGESVSFVGMINAPFPGYPTGISKLVVEFQQRWHRLRSATRKGLGAIGSIGKKVSDRQKLAAASTANPAVLSGPTDPAQDVDALLDAVDRTFDTYRPRAYPGAITLLVSDDELYRGVGRRFDARFRWTRFATSHRVLEFPGGHGDVFDATAAGSFGETLQIALDRAVAEHR